MRPPGLRPDPGTAQDWLRAELARREYQPSPRERLIHWLGSVVDKIDQAGQGLSALGWPLLLLLALVVAGLVTLALARLQRSGPGTTERATVFGDVRRSAADHRRLADAAYAEGDWDTAVLEGVRWLAADLAERRVTPDDPGITTREVTTAAAPRFPDHQHALEDAVRGFEEVRYGGRTADRARADRVLDVVRTVAAASPTAATPGPYLAVPR